MRALYGYLFLVWNYQNRISTASDLGRKPGTNGCDSIAFVFVLAVLVLNSLSNFLIT